MLLHTGSIIITARQRSCRKVMFSLVSVCLFTGGPHMTITHDALDLTVQGPHLLDIRHGPPSSPALDPTPRHQTLDPPSLAWPPLDMRCGTLWSQPLALPSACDIWWLSLETCWTSNFKTPLTGTDVWWPKHIHLASGWYASYWNAFLLIIKWSSTISFTALKPKFATSKEILELSKHFVMINCQVRYIITQIYLSQLTNSVLYGWLHYK